MGAQILPGACAAGAWCRYVQAQDPSVPCNWLAHIMERSSTRRKHHILVLQGTLVRKYCQQDANVHGCVGCLLWSVCWKESTTPGENFTLLDEAVAVASSLCLICLPAADFHTFSVQHASQRFLSDMKYLGCCSCGKQFMKCPHGGCHQSQTGVADVS
jgi:hypothetical protein